MGCDPEIARYSVRWRLDEWAKILAAQGQPISEYMDSRLRKRRWFLCCEAAGVVGTMPNIPANRINTQLNCLGPSFVVASEELSGIRALECAMDALRHGEIDAALVGAVDLSDEVVHRSAASSLLEAQRQPPGDAAVVLLLKRVEDAQRQGDSILATVDAKSIAQMASVPPQSSETPREYNRFDFGLAKGLPVVDRQLRARPCGLWVATCGDSGPLSAPACPPCRRRCGQAPACSAVVVDIATHGARPDTGTGGTE